jgi:hypothetical protein
MCRIAVERLNSPPALSTWQTEPVVSQNHTVDIVERQTPTIVWDTEIHVRWPGLAGKVGIFIGLTKCVERPEDWSKVVAEDAYPKFRTLGGKKLIAIFCVYQGYCTVGSIPASDAEARQFVTAQMDNAPQWKEAYGNTNWLHAEDLAIALQVER